jgi:hypothetical protein
MILLLIRLLHVVCTASWHYDERRIDELRRDVNRTESDRRDEGAKMGSDSLSNKRGKVWRL